MVGFDQSLRVQSFRRDKNLARAPRQLENVKDLRCAMFYLDGRGSAAAKHDSSSSNEEENFGWWLHNDWEIVVSHRGKDHPSSGPKLSTCVDSDDSDSHNFVQDVSRQEQEGSGNCSEKIELSSFSRDELELDVDLIEKDTKETMSGWSMAEDSSMREEVKAICYTPERLIRAQEYKILVPSPRHFTFSQTRLRSGNKSGEWKSRRCRKQLDRLIDSKQIGATQLRVLLNIPDIRTHGQVSSIFERVNGDLNSSMKSSDDHHLADQDRSTGTFSSSRSSYDRLNSTWDDCKDLISRPVSLEDTSGIQSYDWSLEMQSEARSTPMCLCDELAIASRDQCIVNFGNDRDITINEVTSILENLQSDPEKTKILLEEDSLCTSSHDRLTRLALAIETDAEVPSTVSESNNWIHHLRDKIERLELGNKEMHRNIYGLRTNFQCDEKKAVNLSSDTTKLIEDIHELRYFDDLLKLLEGELERISNRNWPFVLGHSEPHEEMNLII
ncbi:LOW QUALITY PROTEIN: uncharacterized protein LOC114938123 [Nylanderia fulva]|uniref:LOW QUALITY PROTEIN: uncharacterized protein LOC114938123 n=1 Tax=Nylanderia fulva TaxID=613905 RepID=UPI0010FB08AF|nr:LOW QUALITY PROTEIN: uncharacterized protein LOC114938123 [Nylanderia fulva]